MLLSSTPLRMSFVGGGSDLPSFYLEEQGCVLSTTIDQYVHICINKKFDDAIRVSYSETENVSTAEMLKHPIVREVLEMVEIKSGIEIVSVADIPGSGTGLGSSSSFTVGLLNGLFSYLGKPSSAAELAALACRVEIDLLNAPIGKQDQYAAAYGGMNLITFNPDESVSVEPVDCSDQVWQSIQENILIFYTGLTRSAGSVLLEQNEAMRKSAKRKLVREMAGLPRVLKRELEAGNVSSFGDILDANWKLKRQLGGMISNQKIDEWYEVGLKNGAIGGKLLGAGNGGFLMFFAPPQNHLRIASKLPHLKKMSFKFERSGSVVRLIK